MLNLFKEHFLGQSFSKLTKFLERCPKTQEFSQKKNGHNGLCTRWGGSKDSENTLNSFLTKRDNDVL